jgi:hypothetical protein
VVQHARSMGLYVNLHSDGYIMQILDDLVEIGYHSWHPLQESAGMDPQTIKDNYGDKFVCYGSLDVIDGLLAYEGDVLAEYITQTVCDLRAGRRLYFQHRPLCAARHPAAAAGAQWPAT